MTADYRAGKPAPCWVVNAQILAKGDNVAKVFCENPTCEAEAVKKVKVSVNKPCDETRHYCYTCYEAYMVGCQHGRKCAERNKQRR